MSGKLRKGKQAPVPPNDSILPLGRPNTKILTYEGILCPSTLSRQHGRRHVLLFAVICYTFRIISCAVPLLYEHVFQCGSPWYNLESSWNEQCHYICDCLAYSPYLSVFMLRYRVEWFGTFWGFSKSYTIRYIFRRSISKNRPISPSVQQSFHFQKISGTFNINIFFNICRILPHTSNNNRR